jgi:hypothetical protein
MSDQSSGDPIVDAVREKLRQRSITGQGKYGVTLADSGLTRLQALRHAQNELLDGANYLEVEIQRETLIQQEESRR